MLFFSIPQFHPEEAGPPLPASELNILDLLNASIGISQMLLKQPGRGNAVTQQVHSIQLIIIPPQKTQQARDLAWTAAV